MAAKSWITCALLALGTVALMAQEKKEGTTPVVSPPPAEAVKIFQLKRADAGTIQQLLRVFPATIQFDRNARTLVVGGSKETVAAIGEAIKQLDVPPANEKNIELTFQMLLATKEASSASAVPKELEAVATQLKSVMGFEGLRLIETAISRVRDGRGGRTSGVLQDIGPQPSTYQLAFGAETRNSSGGSPVIAINNIDLNAYVSYAAGNNSGNYGVQLKTDVDVREGQKAVVGKTSVDNKGSHLILVVSAKLVD